MRPLRLQIAGLNSFRESQTIDFEPLLADGLFGIFGPTGSGKSTILNAITLALYGKARRSGDSSSPSDIINMREKGCSVSFTFEMGNGDARRQYTVERAFGRTKTKGVDTRKVRLIEERGGERVTLSDKKTDVEALIANEIIGLNADDFFRAVVLPQGAFADFLHLTPKARSDALQRLFGLHAFGQQLSIRLKKEAGETRVDREKLAARLEDLRRYDDDALATRETALAQAEAHQSHTRSELDQAKKNLDNARLLWKLLEDYAAVLERESTRPGLEEQLRQLRLRLDINSRSLTVKPLIAEYESARNRHAETERSYQAVVDEKIAVDAELGSTRDIAIRADEAYKATDKLRLEIATLQELQRQENELNAGRERLRLLEHEIAQLDDAHEGKRKEHERLAASASELEEAVRANRAEQESLAISAERRELLKRLRMQIDQARLLNAQVNQKSERYAAAIADISNLDRDIDAARKAERAADAKRSELQAALTDARRAREANNNEREALRARADELNSVAQRLAAFGERRDELHAQIDRQQTSLNELAEQLKQIEAQRDAMRDDEAAVLRKRADVQTRRHAEHRREIIAELADELGDGEPCAVCGAMHHPTPHVIGEHDAHQLALLDAQATDVDASLRDVGERTRAIEQEQARLRAMIESSEQSIRDARERCDVVDKEIETLLADVAPNVSTLEDLSEIRRESDDRLRNIVQTTEAIDERIANTEKQLDVAQQAYIKATTQHAERAGSKYERTNEADRIVREMEELRQEANNIAQRIDADADGQRVDEIEQEDRGRSEKDRRIEELSRAVQVLENDLRQRAGERDLAADALKSVEAEIAVKRERRGELEKELSEKENAIVKEKNTLVPEREYSISIDALIRTRQETNERLEREHNEAQQLFQELQQKETVMKVRYEDRWNALCSDKKFRDDADRACQQALRENEFASIEEAREGLLDAVEQKRCRHEAEEIDRELRDIQLERSKLERLIEGRAITEDEVKANEEQHAIADASNEEAVKATGAADEALKECRTYNREWHELVKQQEATSQRGSMLDQLTKYLRGDAFVNFIADERMEYVCGRASQQLRELTGGRLELGSRSSDGFYILDNGNGGEERSPESLSGGETFLVSLSLALSLSDTIQLARSPLEFFFLDEGFGTLDAELLEEVMNSLEQLRSSHRVIGLITHVGALRERINRRLIVTPATDARGSRVRLEMA